VRMKEEHYHNSTIPRSSELQTHHNEVFEYTKDYPYREWARPGTVLYFRSNRLSQQIRLEADSLPRIDLILQ